MSACEHRGSRCERDADFCCHYNPRGNEILPEGIAALVAETP